MGVKDNLNDANKSAKDLASNMDNVTSSAKAAAKGTGELLNDSRNITEELKEQLGVRTRLNEADKSLLGITRDITKQIQKNIVEAGQSGKIGKLIKDNQSKINSIIQERAAIESALGGLRDQEIKKSQQIAAANIARINAQKTLEGLEQKMAKDSLVVSGKRNRQLEKQIQAQQEVLQVQENSFESIVKGASKDAQKLALLNQSQKLAQENLANSRKEQVIQLKKNQLLGISGNLLNGLNKTAGSIGKAFGLDEVASEMEKLADEIARGNKEGNKLTVLGKGIKTAFSNLGKNLFSPEAIFGALIKGFNDVDKAATDFARQTGQNLNNTTASLATVNMGYVNMADYIKAAVVLTSELNLLDATDIFSPEDILEVAQMTDEMGMAGKAAANLAQLSKLNGVSIRENNESIIQGVNSFNKQNGAAINSRKVLDDISNTSQGVLTKFAGMPGKLTEAATAAAGIGMSLEQVDKIAGSLLNFEQSISAEMEAELLTGKDLNLEKAREAALTNDLATVAKEMSKQVGTSADFAKMNRIQQEATAKAMGMTSDELAGMLLQEDLKKGLNTDSLTNAQKQTLEAQKNRTAQDQIAQSIAKIGQAFAPIIGFVADIVANSLVIYSVMGVALVSKLGGLTGIFSKMGSAFGGIQKAGKSAFKFVTDSDNNLKGMLGRVKEYGKSLITAFKGGKDSDITSGVKDKLADAKDKVVSGAKDKVSGLKDKVTDKITDKADDISNSADKAKGIDGDAGKGVKEFLKGLSEGLKSMASMEVVGGALALIPAAIGLTAMIPGSVGAYLISKVDGEGFKEGLQGIAEGLKSIDGQAMLGGLALIPIALGLAAMLPGVVTILAIAAVGPLAEAGFKGLGKGLMFFGDNFGKIIQGSLALGVAGLAVAGSFALALMMIKDVDPSQMIAFAGSLAIFGATAAILGNFSSQIILGALGLGILALALIPAAFAFSLLEGLDINAMVAFSIALPLLALAAAGLGFIAPLIIAGAFALGTLGLALIPLAAAFNVLSDADMEGMFNSLTTVGSIAPQLLGVGAGLMSIAAGLGAISLTGLLAMPTLLALTTLGAVSGGLGSIFGGAGEDTGGGDENSILSEKLDQVNTNILKLITVVEAGGDVIIDGAVAGKTISMASSQIG